jgi:hypothetical protein
MNQLLSSKTLQKFLATSLNKPPLASPLSPPRIDLIKFNICLWYENKVVPVLN